MFKSVNRISVLKCVKNDGLTISPPNINWIQIFRTTSGTAEKPAKEKLKSCSDLDFSSFLLLRQSQARRSFLMEYKNLEECASFFTVCNSNGIIENIYDCEQQNSKYLLIEMQEKKSFDLIVRNYHEFQQVPVSQQHFITQPGDCTKVNAKTVEKLRHSLTSTSNNTSRKVINLELSKKMNNLNSFIEHCYESLKINEFEVRKKFLMCHQMELLCKGFLTNITAYPFGSSINGFGVSGCDLDIVILHDDVNQNSIPTPQAMEKGKRQLAVISDILKVFSNWSRDVFFIKNAKVPIVKFRNTLTEVDCDLSVYQSHGLATAQMFYTLASFDWKVRALVIFIKLWGQKVGILTKGPGTKLSGFSMSALVIFFLQRIKMLPPLEIFPCLDNQYAMKDDFVSGDILQKLKQECKTDKTLDELFTQFLDFYSQFDFANWGISIRTGELIKNFDKFPIFIENPIHTNLNVCSNIRAYDAADIHGVFSDANMLLSYFSDTEQIRRLFNLTAAGKKKYNIKAA